MKKILVVEDEQAVRENICEALELENFELRSAVNGSEGLKEARNFRPDLIISDVMMPEMDGYGLIAELRKDTKTSTIPFIFLTAKAEMTDLRKGMLLGADDYLSKPFTLKELLSAVNTRLQKQEELKQKTEQKLDSLRNNISTALPHEMRTPLNSIIGFSEMLATDYESLNRNEIAEMARYIYQSGKRLHRTIENFILYSLLESYYRQHEQLEALRFRVTEGLSAMAEEQAKAAAELFERPADLSIQVAEARLRISPDFMEKLLYELAENAFKFSERGQLVQVRGSIVGTRYELECVDKGRGMKAEHLEELGFFSQFERKQYEQQGSGLGLVICKKIMELSEGEIHIESKENEGTRVLLRIPLA